MEINCLHYMIKIVLQGPHSFSIFELKNLSQTFKDLFYKLLKTVLLKFYFKEFIYYKKNNSNTVAHLPGPFSSIKNKKRMRFSTFEVHLYIWIFSKTIFKNIIVDRAYLLFKVLWVMLPKI